MKELFLIRHAKSSWNDPFLEDFRRPLNSRGRKNAPMMGQRLASRKIYPDQIVSSPALRARETALFISEEVDYSVDEIIFLEKTYLAGVGELLEVIQNLDDALERVFLIGHNPGFTDLANWLTNGALDNLPTCAIYAVEIPIHSWSQTEGGIGRCLWIDRPKD